MRFTNAFSVLFAYALFATANGVAVKDDLSGEILWVEFTKRLSCLSSLIVALSGLHDMNAEVHGAVHTRDVKIIAAEPTTIA